MSSTIKKLRKRRISCVLKNPTDAWVGAENEVFLPTSFGETPHLTYTVTEGDLPYILGAQELGVDYGLAIVLGFRNQGASSSIYAAVYVNDVLLNTLITYTYITSNRLQSSFVFCVPCKVGDVIKIYCRCTVANNSALAYHRKVMTVRGLGCFSATRKNKPMVIFSLKVIDWVNVMTMSGEAKSISLANNYNTWMSAKPYGLDDVKYVNSYDSNTVYHTGTTSENKFLGGLLGGFPKNPVTISLYISSALCDGAYSSTAIDSFVYARSLACPALMEVEYLLP